MGCLVPAAIAAFLVILVFAVPYMTTSEGPNNNWDTVASHARIREIDSVGWIKVRLAIQLSDDTYEIKYDLSTVTRWNKEDRNQQLEALGLTARY